MFLTSDISQVFIVNSCTHWYSNNVVCFFYCFGFGRKGGGGGEGPKREKEEDLINFFLRNGGLLERGGAYVTLSYGASSKSMKFSWRILKDLQHGNPLGSKNILFIFSLFGNNDRFN